MSLCKAMILVGALLLVTTLQKRVKQANEFTPHLHELEPEQMIGHEDAHALKNAMKQKVMEQRKDKLQTGTIGKSKVTDTGNRKAKGKTIIKAGQLARKFLFRFPVWSGRWWITRLAFLRGPFAGFVYREDPGTKTLRIKSWMAQEEFGVDVIIPQSCNYVEAQVGDKITFDVKEFGQEGKGRPMPIAKNVVIRQSHDATGQGIVKGPARKDVRTQVLYYLSDQHLRTDKLFQHIIATTEGGWISTDFLLLCKRLKQLGASARSIIESVRDDPVVEVRDIPGQEAVRRISAPPPLEPGATAKHSVAVPLKHVHVIAKHSHAPSAVLAKKIHTKEMMQTVLDIAAEQAMEKLPRTRSVLDLAEAEEEEAGERAKKAADEKAAAQKIALGNPGLKKAVPRTKSGLLANFTAEAEKSAVFAKRSMVKNAAAEQADAEQAPAEKVTEATAVATAAETAEAVYLGEPVAPPGNQKSWRSWFSTLPKFSWGYVRFSGGMRPGATSEKQKSWRSWFLTLPRVAWAYLSITQRMEGQEGKQGEEEDDTDQEAESSEDGEEDETEADQDEAEEEQEEYKKGKVAAAHPGDKKKSGKQGAELAPKQGPMRRRRP